MKTKERIVHHCDFCTKKMFVKPAMEKHEKFCYKNPNNRVACEGCEHLKETTIQYVTDYGYPEGTRSSKSFICEKLNKTLYPRIVERLGINEKYPETFEGQEPMPRDCSEFKLSNLFPF